MRLRPARLPVATAFALLLPPGAPGRAAAPNPVLLRDVMTGTDSLGSLTIPPDPIQDYVQPDTQIEPSIAVNPANPCNAVTAYQEGRIANGGDATNGFATTFDCGATWSHGELPKLTTYPGQGGQLERASDAVVAFGPDNVVYANSLIFDLNVNNGLRSAMAVNVSKDGVKSWSDPVIFQDDNLGGFNDKNWIVVDNSDAPGHHKGRVYVVWDRVAPVVYDYCDHDCDQLANWLPDLQTVDPVAFPAQGIGAYPFILKGGGLGMVIETTTPGVPTGADEPEPGSSDDHVFLEAPAAGQEPYRAPSVGSPPIHISANKSNGIPAQRASDGLPAAASDPKSGALYAVWDDGRFRKDGKNDVVFSTSTDDGQTWSAAKPVNPGPRDDKIDHYGASVAIGDDGAVHVAYRTRDESGKAPLYSPDIDTYYQESRDGRKTWTAPLQVDAQPSKALYDAFSRDGSFEGDYDQLASAGGNTYIARDQGAPSYPGEPAALSPFVDPQDPTTPKVALTEAGKGHQHQVTWVALVREGAGGSTSTSSPTSAAAATPTTGTSVLAATLPSRRSCSSRRTFSIHLRRRFKSAVVTVNGKRTVVRAGKRLKSRIDLRGLPKGRVTVKVVARTRAGRRLVAQRTYHTCVPKKRSR